MIYLFWIATILATFPVLALTQENAAKASSFASKFIQSRYLEEHNRIRAKHHAAPLSWSDSLAEMAERWANDCRFESSHQSLRPEKYGENIVAGTGIFSIRAFVDWIAHEGYDPSAPSYNHFTQLVWKSTTEVGCASNRCKGVFDSKYGRVTLHVCFYNPAGNIIGEAPKNVSP